MHRLTADRKGEPVSGLVHIAAKVTQAASTESTEKQPKKHYLNNNGCIQTESGLISDLFKNLWNLFLNLGPVNTTSSCVTGPESTFH
jgi:hypothetical protein